MSFHAADWQRLVEADGPAMRMYELLTEQAIGAQNGSLAETRKLAFEHDWATDPEKVMRQAEAIEKFLNPERPDNVLPEPEPEPEPELGPEPELEEDDDGAAKPKAHRGRHR